MPILPCLTPNGEPILRVANEVAIQSVLFVGAFGSLIPAEARHDLTTGSCLNNGSYHQR
jgi:hypothetical protein